MVEYHKLFSSRSRLMRASEIRELLKLTETSGVISLAGGLPAPEVLPANELVELTRSLVEEYGWRVLQYSPTRGVGVFLKAVRGFMEKYGVHLGGDDEVIATTGSQEAIYLLARVLLDPGDIVVIEEPSYLTAIMVFRQYGARFLTVPLDGEGMDTSVLEEKLRRAVRSGARPKLVYTIPTCHNPAGVTMSYERRKHLLELAEEFDLIIVEDDPYSYIAFEPIGAPPLKTMDKSGRVVYVSTFSKILAPGLRLGWIAAPRELVEKIELAKQAVDLHTPTLSQYLAAEAIRKGIVDRVIERGKTVYRLKRNTMLRALEEYMPQGVEWTRPKGGLFVWAWLPKGMSARRLLEVAIKHGVAFVPGDAFYPCGGGENTMRLNYSYPSTDEITEGVKRLARAVRELLNYR